MITALVVITSVIVFLVSLVSPHRGTRIQQRAHALVERVHNGSHHKPRLLRLFITVPTTLSHFVVHKSAAVGKRSRWKLPF